jgi:hypothetical protein
MEDIMDESESELAFILAYCKNSEQLNQQIVKYALIVQRLVCRSAKENNQTEEGVRTLYASFADMAIEQLKDQRQFPARKPH